MSKVTLTVGIPASGKSTWAVSEARKTGAVIVCRDDIRTMQGLSHGDNEQLVTKVANAMIEGAILDDSDVIVADTNVNKTFRKALIKLAHRLGADVEIKTFPISAIEAIERDKNRRAFVGADVIAKFYAQFTSQNVQDEFLPVPVWEYYESNPDNIPAIICDLDGTIAGHNRSPYDYSKVSTDFQIENVIDVVVALAETYQVIFVSGRPDSCRIDTVNWIHNATGMVNIQLFMRKTGDDRPDYVIKNEIYDGDIFPKYNVVMSFDDRDQVVTHMRKRGITVAQVAYGRF